MSICSIKLICMHPTILMSFEINQQVNILFQVEMHVVSWAENLSDEIIS